MQQHQSAVGSRRGLGFSEYLNPIVDLVFEFFFVDEAVNLHCAEEVADAFADAGFGEMTYLQKVMGDGHS